MLLDSISRIERASTLFRLLCRAKLEVCVEDMKESRQVSRLGKSPLAK
jgi:hypothetical protein